MTLLRMWIGLGCALAPSIAAQEPEASDGWPQWRGARHDGLSHGCAWSAHGTAVWSRDVGLGHSSPSISRVREIRTHGWTGDLRKRSARATAPEVYQ